MRTRTLLLAAAGLGAVSSGALAQDATQTTQLDEVVVTADPLGRSGRDVISNVAILRGDELAHRRQATLGETLNGLPGVSSDTFGGGASRPVIRGQTAPRVKVLSDGAALLDASEVSPDHAVSGEPLLLEGVEILRGPSALLYGGGAIGGAVNLLDRKTPSRLPVDGYEGVAELRLGSADDERSAVLGVTGGLGPFAIRLEASGRRSNDYDVPFYTPSHGGHAVEDPDHDHGEEGFDRVAGSFNDTRTLTLGGSWIGSRGYLGAAFTEQRSEYGLPGHSHDYESCHPHGVTLHCGAHGPDDGHDHGDHAGEGPPVVELVSRRVDVRGEINDPFAGVERIRFRGGFTDYRHDEMDDGEVATTFTNQGHDARIEVQHAPIGGLRGVIGAQTSRSDFAAVGVEAFLPPSRIDNHALFLLEEHQRGDWRFEGALRQEWQNASAQGRASRSHTPLSVSAGASWTFRPGYVLSASAARSQRAPTAQELYAGGVHLATNTYEIGSDALDVETAHSLELTLRKMAGELTFSVGAYRYAYDGYIYADTLDQHEDFRLIRYSQADARFTGVEADVTWKVRPDLSFSVFGDKVKAELTGGGGDLPRIPAARLGVRADLWRGPVSADLEYVRVFNQDRIADFEDETPGYDMVNATLAYDVDVAGTESQIFLRGTNLLDETALNHASFIGHLAPLRGRNLVVGMRARF